MIEYSIEQTKGFFGIFAVGNYFIHLTPQFSIQEGLALAISDVGNPPPTAYNSTRRKT
jgi:hypothetical protein